MKIIRWIAAGLALLLAAGCSSGAKSAAPSAPDGTPQHQRVPVLRLAGGTDWGAPGVYLHSSRGPGNAKKDLIFASLLEADETGIGRLDGRILAGRRQRLLFHAA